MSEQNNCPSDVEEKWQLRLYVPASHLAPPEPLSMRKLCESELKGRYELEVIDIYQNPSLAGDEQILAAPNGKEGKNGMVVQ